MHGLGVVPRLRGHLGAPPFYVPCHSATERAHPPTLDHQQASERLAHRQMQGAPVLASTVEVAKVIAAPAAARALYELSARAYAAGDALELLAGQLERAGRRAAVLPVPPVVAQPERVVSLGELLRLAREQGRAVFAP